MGGDEMKRFLLSSLAFLAASYGEDKTPVIIDIELQFEMRTLEAQYAPIQAEGRRLEREMNAKMEQMRGICGADFTVAVDPKTTKYVCKEVVKPVAAQEKK